MLAPFLADCRICWGEFALGLLGIHFQFVYFLLLERGLRTSDGAVLWSIEWVFIFVGGC